MVGGATVVVVDGVDHEVEGGRADSLVFTLLVPTLCSWNEKDDRQVICVLADFQGAPLTGTKKGARV